MLFSVFMTVINHIPYEFYQPYIQLLGGEAPTPLLTGLHTALTMGIAAWFAKQSIRLRDHFGTRSALMLSTGVQVVLISMMGFFFSSRCRASFDFSLCPSRAYDCAPQCGSCSALATTPSRDVSFNSEPDWAFVIFALSCSSRWCFIVRRFQVSSCPHTLSYCAVFAIVGCAFLAVIAIMIPRSRWRLTSE